MKKAYLLQCVYEEGSAFELDIDNHLFADIELAKDELEISTEETYNEFVYKFPDEEITIEWSDDHTRATVSREEELDTWTGKIIELNIRRK